MPRTLSGVLPAIFETFLVSSPSLSSVHSLNQFLCWNFLFLFLIRVIKMSLFLVPALFLFVVDANGCLAVCSSLFVELNVPSSSLPTYLLLSQIYFFLLWSKIVLQLCSLAAYIFLCRPHRHVSSFSLLYWSLLCSDVMLNLNMPESQNIHNVLPSITHSSFCTSSNPDVNVSSLCAADKGRGGSDIIGGFSKVSVIQPTWGFLTDLSFFLTEGSVRLMNLQYVMKSWSNLTHY